MLGVGWGGWRGGRLCDGGAEDGRFMGVWGVRFWMLSLVLVLTAFRG